MKHVQSSIIVIKYIFPLWSCMWYGPQISQCIKSKGTLATWLVETKDSCFCLAKGHTEQICLPTVLLNLKLVLRDFSFSIAGCQILRCHWWKETVACTLICSSCISWNNYKPLSILVVLICFFVKICLIIAWSWSKEALTIFLKSNYEIDIKLSWLTHS